MAAASFSTAIASRARPLACTIRRTFSKLSAPAALGVVLLATGCGRIPSPVTPWIEGSIGLPHKGVLTGAVALPSEGPGFKRLRDDKRNFGTARFVHALERAAQTVAEQRPGGTLVVGDLSEAHGGQIVNRGPRTRYPHLSHRNGRDADLLLYATTLEGAPVTTSGFVHFGADGLGWDTTHNRYLRFDAERQWLLIKALLEYEQAQVQFVFVSRPLELLLLEWARARGESVETLYRAEEVMHQPHPGEVHDDHIHVRTACSREELASGCEHSGPVRPWLVAPSPDRTEGPSNDELAGVLMRPLDKEPSTPLASLP